MTRFVTPILLLDDCHYSRALARVLRARPMFRKLNDSDWDWPRRGISEFASFIIVTGQNSSASRAVRWHADAWREPRIRQARCAILVMDGDLTGDLLRRDVFGRLEDHGESFSDWSQHVAVIPASAGLSALLNRTTTLTYCPVKTWKRKAEEAAVIPALHTAIQSRDGALLLEILRRANQQDWDAVCHPHPHFGDPHQYANHVRKWLSGVTRNVTPNWAEGEALISPLAAKNKTEPCNNT